jgi:protocatechuate 3,4-dioxygenase beta subunit
MFIKERITACVVLCVLGLAGVGIFTSILLAHSHHKPRPGAGADANESELAEATQKSRQSGITQPATQEAKSTIQVCGQVLDPDGKPVQGARVFALEGTSRAIRAPENCPTDLTDEAMTDAQGRFELRARAPEGDQPPAAVHPLPAIFVLADRYGMGLQAVPNKAKTEPMIFRLAREQVLGARFLDDTSGKPVAGLVVQVVSVGHGGGHVGPPNRAPRAWYPPMKTDTKGRIRLHGIASGQWVFVEWCDARFQSQRLALWRTEAHWRGQEVVYQLMPPIPEFVSGQVTFQDTGKPAAGVSVRTRGAKAKTDRQGRFRLKPDWEVDTNLRLGAAAGSATEYVTLCRAPVDADAPAGSPYLSGRGEPGLARTPRRDGMLGPWELGELRLALPRGIHVQGRVLEAGTNKAVPGASVTFGMYQATSGLDGTFALTAAPGSGHLVVTAAADYAPAEAMVDAGRLLAHAVVPVAFKAGPDPKPMEIALRRGVVVKGKLTGPDGQPVQGAVLLSRLLISHSMNRWINSPSPVPSVPVSADFQLKGCHPDKSYPVIFFQEQKGWGAEVAISGKQADKPVEVRLQPCGAAKARFLTAEGRPVAGGDGKGLLLVLGAGDTAFWAGFIEHSNIRADWHTDSAGRITWRNLVSGVTYRINHRDFTVKPGETLDLGDLK